MSHFKEYIAKEIEMMHQLDLDAIEEVGNMILACYEQGGNIFICGNGGSGASASKILQIKMIYL
jgi:D-sedoheptulose 7-phosphate isomerase